MIKRITFLTNGENYEIAVATAVNPVVGVIVGSVWLLAGNLIWDDFTFEM